MTLENDGMKSAERLNHDQFDLLCRASDVGGPATLAELSEVLEGVNLLPRAKVAAEQLILEGFLAQTENLYVITAEGTQSLA